jgi:hypothetical protein
VNVMPKDKETSQTDKLMLTEMINQGSVISQLTGRKFNASKLIQKYERAWKERDMFEKEPREILQAGQVQGGQELPGEVQAEGTIDRGRLNVPVAGEGMGST